MRRRDGASAHRPSGAWRFSALYQRWISPAFGPRCRYYPSCSEYAVQAVQRFGILRGLVLAAWRLLRCNPLSHGGFDPVTEQRLFTAKATRPRDLTMLTLANIFQPLIDIFEPALKFFHDTVGVSWGWSIVLLTVVIRALLLPLAFRQFHSMQKLQRAAPELKAIQAKYKEDKQRQQQEVMKFYRENEINPFASCLPLVAQIPVFIGLFYTLRTRLRAGHLPRVKQPPPHYANGHSVAQAAAHTTLPVVPDHGAGFLFIHDITSPATGLTLVALIVLYVGTQLASTLMMSTPTMDPTQRRIMMLMPLFFVIFIINFPSGLIVYWITTNAWTMLQQYVIRRRIGPVTPLTQPPRMRAAEAEPRTWRKWRRGPGAIGTDCQWRWGKRARRLAPRTDQADRGEGAERGWGEQPCPPRRPAATPAA